MPFHHDFIPLPLSAPLDISSRPTEEEGRGSQSACWFELYDSSISHRLSALQAVSVITDYRQYSRKLAFIAIPLGISISGLHALWAPLIGLLVQAVSVSLVSNWRSSLYLLVSQSPNSNWRIALYCWHRDHWRATETGVGRYTVE